MLETTKIVYKVSSDFISDFIKKMGAIFFFFLKKKHRKKIIQSIRNVNVYPNKSIARF